MHAPFPQRSRRPGAKPLSGVLSAKTGYVISRPMPSPWRSLFLTLVLTVPLALGVLDCSGDENSGPSDAASDATLEDGGGICDTFFDSGGSGFACPFPSP